eukprot:4378311-Prymnesium_polylepis.1
MAQRPHQRAASTPAASHSAGADRRGRRRAQHTERHPPRPHQGCATTRQRRASPNRPCRPPSSLPQRRPPPEGWRAVRGQRAAPSPEGSPQTRPGAAWPRRGLAPPRVAPLAWAVRAAQEALALAVAQLAAWSRCPGSAPCAP